MRQRVLFEVTFKLGDHVFTVPSDSKRLFNRLFIHERPFQTRFVRPGIITKSREQLITKLIKIQSEESLHSKRMEWRGRGDTKIWQPSSSSD